MRANTAAIPGVKMVYIPFPYLRPYCYKLSAIGLKKLAGILYVGHLMCFALNLKLPDSDVFHPSCEYSTYKCVKEGKGDCTIPIFPGPINPLFKNVANKANMIVVTSAQVKRTLIRMGINTCIKVIHSGADEELLEEKPKKLNEIKSCLLISRLIKGKGIERYLKLAEKYPKVEFRLIGGGPLESMARRYVATKQLKNVTIFGECSHDKTMKILKESDILTHPSDYESHSLAILEAWALAKPTIITPFSGNAQDHGEHLKNTWILRRDFLDLEEALQYFIDKPSIATTIGQNARQTIIRKKLTWDGFVKDLEKLYKQLKLNR